MEAFNIEQWRTVSGYPDYLVSNHGRIMNATTKKILKPRMRGEYHTVALWKDMKRKDLAIHRIVAMEFLDNSENKPFVDHINGVKTDNKLSNLRWATRGENQRNSKKAESKSSKFKGVSKEKNSGKFIATICIDRKNIHIGRFKTEEEAAKAYDEKARELFGEFAKFNFQ